MWNLHLNLTQDIGHGITIIFLCCVLVIAACFIDLWTGVDAARKNKEKIRSKALRRTVSKILDYLRVVFFAVLSVLENFHKKKSSAAEIMDVIETIVNSTDNETAEKIIKAIKYDGKIKKEEKNDSKGNLRNEG